MSGSGVGRGSGRAHFRSKSGCCICGTKSSSSRFTASERYAEHFGNCFGEAATNRSGDLCNACVLCVKRWLSRGKEPGRFKQVLDSKRGPGPKHMKEIAKRARRREAKKQQQQEIIQIQKQNILHNHQSFSSTRSVNSRVAASFSKNGNIASSSSQSPGSSSLALHSHHHGHHHGHHNHLGHHSATCVACWADQNNAAAKAALVNSPSSPANSNGLVNNSATASTPLDNAGGTVLPSPVSGTNVVRTRSSMSRKLDLASRSIGNLVKTDSVMDSDAVNKLTDFSTSSASSSLRHAQRLSDTSSFTSASLSRSGFAESSSDNHSPASLQHNHEHFRPPRPPPGATSLFSGHSRGGGGGGGVVRNPSNTSPCSGVGVLTRAAASASAAASLTAAAAANCFAGFFDGGASSTASSTTSTPSTPTRRHNRRTRLPPVKISSTGLEVDDILRKIQKDNKNMNLDNHQINMAVQREIRLRNRIINPPPVMAFAGGPPVVNRTPSGTSSGKDRLGNAATAASTTTLSDAASVEGSVDASSTAAKSSVDLRV